MNQCKVPRYEAELQNLEEMAGKIVVAAFNLPPGVSRYESLMLIDSFCERIAAMKRPDPSQHNARSQKSLFATKVFPFIAISVANGS
jgi:hypothetical protein